MVVSGGELQREFVEGQGLGIVVRPGDGRALADAIRSLKARATSAAFAPAFAAAREKLAWSATVRPIVAYCTSAVARTRKVRRPTWSARLQLVEFFFRSFVIRAVLWVWGARSR